MIEGILLCISLGIFYLVGVHLIRANRIIYEVYRLLKFISENKKVTADNKNNTQPDTAQPEQTVPDLQQMPPVQYYTVDFNRVQDIQDVKDLLVDMNLKLMLFPGQSLDQQVTRPDLWVQVDEAA